jgi:hypothetical protein
MSLLVDENYFADNIDYYYEIIEVDYIVLNIEFYLLFYMNNSTT